MENRLYLNKKPVYELPDNTRVQVYQSSDKVKRLNITPNFEPDICLKVWGNSMKVEEKYKSNCQVWVKTDNEDLINFIKNYNPQRNSLSTLSIGVNDVKKIILEEFYGVKNGE